MLQLLSNAEVVFCSHSLKMMNIHGPFYFLVLKASDQNQSISNYHDVGAKILKRRLHIKARLINSNFNEEKQFVKKVLLSFQVLNEFK